MGSELSFLLDLILNHKLPKATRELIVARVKEVESAFAPAPRAVMPAGSIQAASTMALMAKHGDPLPVPPEAIAQTPQTQAAIAHREAIMSGKLPATVQTGKSSQGPRKW